MRSNITRAIHPPDCVDIELRISKGLTLDMRGGRPCPHTDLMQSTCELLLSRALPPQSWRVCNSVMSSLSRLIVRFSVRVTLCVVDMSQSSYLLHHDKRDFDKTEELYKKALQQNHTVQQRCSTTLHIFVGADGCARHGTCMQAHASKKL